jgi:hypothetical protein
MKILLVADGRSTTTRSWVRGLAALGYQVTLVTTYPCAPVEGVEADVTVPVAFSALGGSGAGNLASDGWAGGRAIVPRARGLFLAMRHLLGPLTLRYYGPRLRWLVERIQPDIVHALRVPFEGMLATYTPPDYPLALSIWGNDLTLHAQGSVRMGNLTRKALARADALFADTQRDVRLAHTWGFSPLKSALVVPGCGGIDLEQAAQVKRSVGLGEAAQPPFLPAGAPLVLNHAASALARCARTPSSRRSRWCWTQAGCGLCLRGDGGQKEALDWVSAAGVGGQNNAAAPPGAGSAMGPVCPRRGERVDQPA